MAADMNDSQDYAESNVTDVTDDVENESMTMDVGEKAYAEAQGYVNIGILLNKDVLDVVWNKRWCRVRDGYLYVFRSRKMDPDEVFAVVWLRDCQLSTEEVLPRAEQNNADPTEQALRFDVITPVDGTLMFLSASPDSKLAWVEFITENIELANSQEPGESEAMSVDGEPVRVLTHEELLSNSMKIDKLIERASRHIDIKNRSYRLTTYKKCFIGSTATDWFARNVPLVNTRQEAVKFGQLLMDSHVLHHVCCSEPFRDGHFFYRFQKDDTPDVLNTKLIWNDEPRPATEVALDMRKRVLRLYGEFMSDDGMSLDLEGMAQSDAFKEFSLAVCELQRVDLLQLDRSQKLAFFINLYNILVIHGQAELGAPTTAWQRSSFFSNTKYNVGGHVYSLNDIEHGVLRGNSKPVGAWTRLFNDRDPRLVHSMQPVDPRIHFALNCGAKSCPPIKVYSPDNLEYALSIAAQGFCEAEIEVDGRNVTLSKIMSWYKSDFGATDADMLRTLAGYLGGERGLQLEALANGSFSISYRTYDWSSLSM